MNRRTFFQNIGRASIAAGLIGISAVLLSRENNAESDCTLNFACKNCKTLDKCTLPQGINYKTSNGIIQNE